MASLGRPGVCVGSAPSWCRCGDGCGDRFECLKQSTATACRHRLNWGRHGAEKRNRQKARGSGHDHDGVDIDDHRPGSRLKPGGRRESTLAAACRRNSGEDLRSLSGCSHAGLFDLTTARGRLWHSCGVRGRSRALVFRREQIVKIAIGFVFSFIIGAGCRYFDIPAASPPVIPGALIVLAMTLGYTSMDRVLIRKDRAATTKHLCGGPTGLPQSMAGPTRPSPPESQARS